MILFKSSLDCSVSIASQLDDLADLEVDLLPRSVGDERVKQQDWHLEEMDHNEWKHVFWVEDWVAASANSLHKFLQSRDSPIPNLLLLSVVFRIN